MRMTAMKKRNKKREQGGKIPAAPLLAAVLVLSGCTSAKDVENYAYRPHYILNGVGDIPPAK